jgi:hypothetical protein
MCCIHRERRIPGPAGPRSCWQTNPVDCRPKSGLWALTAWARHQELAFIGNCRPTPACGCAGMRAAKRPFAACCRLTQRTFQKGTVNEECAFSNVIAGLP